MEKTYRNIVTALAIFTASISQAEPVIVGSISGDWNQDNIPDRAFLLGTPGAEALDLGIWLDNAAGEDTDLAFLIKGFASKSSPDSTAAYPPGNGDSSLLFMVDGIRFSVVDFNSAKGWMAQTTIGLNTDGQPVVIAYARERFLSESTQVSQICTANFEDGQGVVQIRGSSEVEASFPVQPGPILANEWPLFSIDFPDICETD